MSTPEDNQKIRAAERARVSQAILARLTKAFGQPVADRASRNPEYLRHLQLELGKRR
jgi:hypothetical protein